MERVQSLQKMQVLTRQKANLAAQLEACPSLSLLRYFVLSIYELLCLECSVRPITA